MPLVSRWRAIQESGELRRMSRTHIHFATEPHHQRTNNWATVLLLLDLRAAIQAGLEFVT
jgi:RNA:NAD 2'-phosphotransferase (TPT1/KptA family)